MASPLPPGSVPPQGYPPSPPVYTPPPGYPQPPQGYPGMRQGYPPMPPGYYPPVPAGPPIASFARRAGAFIIDVILIGIVAFVIAIAANLPGIEQTTAPNGTTTYMMTNSGWSQVLVGGLSFIYSVVLWLTVMGTLGQRMLGLRVCRTSGPQAITPEGAVIRWALLFGVTAVIGAAAVAAPSVSGLLSLVQLIWIIVLIVTTYQSPMTQGIHDRYAGSIVVH